MKYNPEIHHRRSIRLQTYDYSNHYENIELDEVVIMPNHLHGIIWINVYMERAGLKPAPTDNQHGLPEFMRALKTFSSREINKNRHTPGTPVWQRNYFDRIIRNDTELSNIREYIRNNPLQWELDENNPVNFQGRV